MLQCYKRNVWYMNWRIVLGAMLLLPACTSEQKKEDACYLQPTEQYLKYEIDEDTRIPLYHLHTFETGGVEYMTFPNRETRTLLVYELLSGKLVKKVSFHAEGPNGIGPGLYGYLMKDFDHIYVAGITHSVIYRTDTTGIIREKILFPETEDGMLTEPSYYTNLGYKQLHFIDGALYIPQGLNRALGTDRWVEESPTAVVMDTLTRKVKRFPMLHPQGKISSEDYNNYMADLTYSMTYDGENFIYSFSCEDELYRVAPSSASVEKMPATSRYLPTITFKKIPDDFRQIIKASCEMPDYGNILYDPYRKVYYRFAFPETELEDGLNYMQILHNGKKEFSIIILDENLHVIGETKFPPFSYVPHIFFIREDGLYISTSHFMREDYSDDILCFQRFELKRK